MAEAVEKFQLLPFFPNNVSGLSIEEMCAPGLLFGGNYDEGCWEWKGPVIRRQIAAYGKFFRRKAGFVGLELLPDFLNYRRKIYPVKPGEMEEMLLDIIKENDSLTSTELKQLIFGSKRRNWEELVDNNDIILNKSKRKSLESLLQKLQMGGWILISDFEYKRTKNGERYGWGVARYSTPEVIFGELLEKRKGETPQDSLDYIINFMKKKIKFTTANTWKTLLK